MPRENRGVGFRSESGREPGAETRTGEMGGTGTAAMRLKAIGMGVLEADSRGLSIGGRLSRPLAALA